MFHMIRLLDWQSFSLSTLKGSSDYYQDSIDMLKSQLTYCFSYDLAFFWLHLKFLSLLIFSNFTIMYLVWNEKKFYFGRHEVSWISGLPSLKIFKYHLSKHCLGLFCLFSNFSSPVFITSCCIFPLPFPLFCVFCLFPIPATCRIMYCVLFS